MRQAALRENRLSSGDGHNLLQDVQLTYKGDPAPKEPSRVYDSSHKLNVVIKGWCTINNNYYSTVEPLLTDTSIIQAPLLQIVHWSGGVQNSYNLYLCNTDIFLIQTVNSGTLVSILKRFDSGLSLRAVARNTCYG